jgi:plasmid stability protein
VPSIVIRDLEPETIERLKAQAERHGRSMQAEAKSIIVGGVGMSVQEWLAEADWLRARTKPGLSSVELLHEARAERDATILRAMSGDDGDTDD